MSTPLLVDYFRQLPQAKEGESPKKFAARFRAAVEAFKVQVAGRYAEGTLLRLLAVPDATTRRAATLALGLTGTLDANGPLATLLHDADEGVRQFAADALWSLWFRADSEENNQELQRLLRLHDPDESLAGLNALVRRAPGFAEAFNQRAILYFRRQEFRKSAADCERALELNPFHFGALGGLGQCHMHLRRPRAALKAFRRALQLNPHLHGVAESVRELESLLGEEERKDDKK